MFVVAAAAGAIGFPILNRSDYKPTSFITGLFIGGVLFFAGLVIAKLVDLLMAAIVLAEKERRSKAGSPKTASPPKPPNLPEAPASSGQAMPVVDGNTLTFENGVALKITEGTLEGLDPEGYVPALVVGMGKLTLEDPMAKKYPLVRIDPVEGKVELEVTR
jgi:hypothetical protein